MSDLRANGDDEREDLEPGERQYTSADLTAHDAEEGQLPESDAVGEPDDSDD
ncbi:hypothetical protein [Leifsonia sp. 2MCAF36]|uniref:hypothetical protein n=1 Tax=Leifsonia sp. 2MCAF36 TaxID=3232988 RepID=UPI003F981C02